MESVPSIIVLSTHAKEATHVVKGILEVECVPEPSFITNLVKCWQWEIENKYYNASVQIAAVSCPEQCLSWILKHGEALLVYCDSTQKDVLDSLNGLVESIGEFEPDVQLLVCDACTSEESNEGLSRIKAQQWCISNGWELIELNPITTSEPNNSDEDDFPESWGFKRIHQALNANTWSNLKMRDWQGSKLNAVLQSVATMDDKKSECMHETDEIMYSRLANLTLNAGMSESSITTSHLQNNDGQNNELDEIVVPSQLAECRDGDEDFENLFSNFEHLKRTAATLPLEQRRDYAEKVAVAFWRAMGGDEDEVICSDSD